ncbi:MAG: Gx transporter family protein, partial [Lachnospiraceae bacterium]|nr:Gx transporter family protein [Lachnospiraceae bacterium]
IIRIVLCGLTFGSISSMIYSLAGGLLSYLVMFLLKKTDRFSIYGVSVAGGISHNFGQIIMAIIILQTKLLIYYYPVLLLSGSIAGVLIGMISALLVKRLKSVYITE